MAEADRTPQRCSVPSSRRSPDQRLNAAPSHRAEGAAASVTQSQVPEQTVDDGYWDFHSVSARYLGGRATSGQALTRFGKPIGVGDKLLADLSEQEVNEWSHLRGRTMKKRRKSNHRRLVRGLAVEQLEDRRLLAGTSSFFDVSFTGGVTNESPNNQSGLVFVGMAFDGQDSTDTYAAIKDECERIELTAARVDEGAGSAFILREVLELIHKAEFLVFDLTKERPNVYYELGYAHGCGNVPDNILLIAAEGTRLHFDVAPLRVQFYRSTEDLRAIVREQLPRMLAKSRTMRSAETPPVLTSIVGDATDANAAKQSSDSTLESENPPQ